MIRPSLLFSAFLLAGATLVQAAPAAPLPATPAPAPPTGAATTSAPAASPLYTEIIGDYMNGRWDTLEKTLKENLRDLAKLSPTEQSDISAIRLALREGRQDWWAKTKAGAKTPIKVSLWGRTIPVLYDPKTQYGVKITLKNGLQALAAAWPAADMDSTAPAEAGFTKGDSACLTAFGNLGQLDSWFPINPVAAKDEIPLERFLEFRGKLTGMAYGTPGALRYGLWICLSSYGDVQSKLQIRMARRAVATMFLGELLTHPENFAGLELPKTLAADKAEEDLCNALATQVQKQPFTFTEDETLRTAVKHFAAANGSATFRTATVNLPNKLTVALDPKADGPALRQRNAWLKQQFDKLPADRK